MKLKLLLIFLLTASSISVFGQAEKYYHVKISISDSRDMQHLASLGLALEEGEYQPGEYFISDFSESEVALIKKSGFHFQVLISDMAAYYESRNKNITDEISVEPAATNCPYAVPKNFKLGTMGGFLTNDAMLATLDSMRKKYPNLISVKQPVSSTLTSIEGRQVYYVRISNNPDVDQSKPEVLYTGLHHAREPISMQHLIFYMWYLLENYSTDPSVKNLMDNEEMYFIPCVNPDGYVYNQTTNPNGGGLWRKNRRHNNDNTYGVDLNRNYGYKWGYDNIGSSNVTSSDTYRGTAAFSEPETQIVRDFCEQHNFYIIMNNHSYDNVIVYPYGYIPNLFTPDQPTYKAYSDSLRKCNKFKTGTANQTVGYTVNGSSDDWMYGDQTDKNKEFAFTPETGSASDGFWPKKNKITTLCVNDMDMNLQAAKLTLAHATAPLASAKDNNENVPTAISIYQNSPNPVGNTAYVNYQIPSKDQANYALSIFNLMGIRVKQMIVDPNQSSVQINVNDLPSGFYYYMINSSTQKSAMMKMQVVK